MFSGVHTQPVGYETDMIQCPESSHYGISLPGSVFRVFFKITRSQLALLPTKQTIASWLSFSCEFKLWPDNQQVL